MVTWDGFPPSSSFIFLAGRLRMSENFTAFKTVFIGNLKNLGREKKFSEESAKLKKVFNLKWYEMVYLQNGLFEQRSCIVFLFIFLCSSRAPHFGQSPYFVRGYLGFSFQVCPFMNWHKHLLHLYFFNLEKQDSIWQQGDSARINLEKIVTHYTPDGYPFFDKVYRTTKDFAIDTSLIGCMGFRIINFPQESLINDPYPPIIDSISHNLIDGYAILKARIRDYCNYVGNVYDTLHYKIKWQNDSLINEVLADSIVNDYHYYKISGIPANQQCSVYCKIKAKDSFGNSSYALYNFYAYWTKTGENKTYVIDEKNNRRIRVLYLGRGEYKRLKKLMEKGFMVYDISGRRIRENEIKKSRVYILRREK